ncbi:MAG: hypothetical protein IV086_14515 [Hyphomonadaceae bacterium]|nr:MAG: hypothetical protein FD160_2961 [Caulobacteraceae bacterium]MBT9446910.1 hypothetical protein [Hyphomonadaceae bacterium]TPW08683.1 MAG: hypothetical protein FD124_222 [Alphaproteobacteria bacterium]
MESIVIPITLFGMILGIVAVSVWGSVQSKKEANETVRRAIDAGQPLDSAAISAIGKPVRSAAQDLRGGIVLVSLATGLIFAGLMAAGALPGIGKGWDDDAGMGFFIAAAIVGAIGVGQLVAALVRGNEKKGA